MSSRPVNSRPVVSGFFKTAHVIWQAHSKTSKLCQNRRSYIITLSIVYHSAGKHDRGPLFFTLFSFRLLRSRSAGSISVQNILIRWEILQEKEAILLENYKHRAKTRQHCYTKLCKVAQKCHIQVPKEPC